MRLKFGIWLSSLCFKCLNLESTDFGNYECGKSGMIFVGIPGVTHCNVFEPIEIKKL